jgi:hypothetical protein
MSAEREYLGKAMLVEQEHRHLLMVPAGVAERARLVREELDLKAVMVGTVFLMTSVERLPFTLAAVEHLDVLREVALTGLVGAAAAAV